MRLPVPHVLVSLLAVTAIVDTAASSDTAALGEEARADVGRFPLRSVEITRRYLAGTATPRPRAQEWAAPDVHPRVGLTLSNKTERTLWLRVRLTGPPPNPTCDWVRGPLGPKQAADCACAQDTLVAGVDYRIDIVVFADRTLADTVEKNSTRLRLDAGDLKTLDARLETRSRELEAERQLEAATLKVPVKLPQTYKHIILKERLGLGASVDANFFKVGLGGTLVVKPDGLEYKTKNRSITLSAAQVRRVSLRDPAGPWVVVDYDDAGTSKLLAFEAAMGFNPMANARIHDSIQAMIGRAGEAQALALSDASPRVDSSTSTWPTDPLVNVAVCTAAGDHTNPMMVADGAGGAIVTWEDSRGGTGDIYAQHVMGSGAVDPAWAADGRALCTAPGDQFHPVIVADGAGGAVVAWVDRRAGAFRTASDLYALHVLASGAVDPAWPPGGRALTTGDGTRGSPSMVEDGAGGAIVTWLDSRSAASYAVYAQRVLASGAVDPAWPAEGRVLCAAVAPMTAAEVWSLAPFIVADGAGGAIVAWEDRRGGGGDVYAQHVLGSGIVDPGWPADGRAVCTAPANQQRPRIVADGAGGAIIAWTDEGKGGGVQNYGDESIFAQHVLATGAVDPAWPAGGRALSADKGYQGRPEIVADGAGGAIVVWDSRSNVCAQHVLASGVLDRVWPADARRLCTVDEGQGSPKIVADGAGGAIVTWEDRRTSPRTLFGAGDIYAQHVLASGVVDPAWPAGCRALSVDNANQYRPEIVTDGAGGAIVVWTDRRGGGAKDDLYAQGVKSNGQLGDVVVVLH